MTRGAGPRPRRRARLAAAVTAAIAVALIVAGGIGILAINNLLVEGATSTRDLQGAPVVADPGTTPSTQVAEAMDVVEDAGTRFRVPSVGLDVPLGALSVVDGTVTPPGFTSAYWVRNRGASIDAPASGTVFVVMHSLRGGGVAPGNYLIDIAQGRSRVADHAIVTVGGIDYTVTGSQAIAKDQLATTASVWENTPNRLVIITCLQVPSGAVSVQNFVITATRN